VIAPLPFRLGRGPTANLVVHSRGVSKEHAEIVQCGDEFILRDLGSTNGTFINGRAVAEAVLRPGDIVHLAHKEFRFGMQSADEVPAAPDSLPTDLVKGALPLSLILGSEVLREVLRHEQVQVVFQPIVRLDTGQTFAYEALGRCTHQDLSPSPADLFLLAEKVGLAADLSRLFRRTAVMQTPRLPGDPGFFFNVHPAEMEDPEFVGSLAEAVAVLRDCGRNLFVEIHEDAVASPAAMRELCDQLREIGAGVAYDDFGAGQARLAQLAEAPPDFVKLDMNLIRGIDKAPARQDLVRALVQVAGRLGVRTLAEGVETPEEASACRKLGCLFAQGFLFGRPAPASAFFRSSPTVPLRGVTAAVRQRLREMQE
jgi:EAL domain-containing protein (putative c-di-GMP-specific phosphodiesterase class I)